MSRSPILQTVFKQLVLDSVHGGFFKVVALLARILFFVLVVPKLAAGELTVYVYVNSTAIIIAVVVVLGLGEELPRIIRGDINVACDYLPWFVIFNLLALLTLSPLHMLPSITLGVVAFALASIAGRFLGGIIRSVDPAAFEQIQNVPWVLFMICAVTMRLDNAFDLLTARAATMCIVQWYGYIKIVRGGEKTRTRKPVALLAVVKHGYMHGTSKLISNVFLLGFMRAPIMLPVWLGFEENLDSVAFAVAVGDVITQFGLIPANRSYAIWCKNIPLKLTDWLHANIRGLFLTVALASTSLVLVLVANRFHFLTEQDWSSGILTQSLIFYSALSAFRLMRYLVWSRGQLEHSVTILSGLLFTLGAVAVAFVQVEYWFACLSVLTLSAWLALALTSRRLFEA